MRQSIRLISTFLTIAAVILIVPGCELFEYSPFDTRVEPSRKDLTAVNMSRLASMRPASPDSFSFAFITDTHSRYDDFRDAVESINRNPRIMFVLHGGDLTDHGLEKEYTWAVDILERLRIPFFCTLGNHDCLSNGRKIHEQIFGKACYSFILTLDDSSKFKFIVLNDNLLEYTRHERESNSLEKQVRESLCDCGGYYGVIVAAHVPPSDSDYFERAVEERLRSQLADSGVLLFLHGHTHRFAFGEQYHDGVLYLGGDAIRNRNYCIITIYTGEKAMIHVTQVHF